MSIVASDEPAEAFPPSWEADVVLRDGLTVRVRPIVPDDIDRLDRFHTRQSAESIYFRFFSPRPRLSARELHHFTHVEHSDRVAFVAVLDDEIVGVARYERYRGTDTAEVAFFVDDQHHGRGLATVLLEFLVAAGRHRGIRRFTASTLPTNRRMLAVFSAAGYEVSSQLSDGVVEVAFDIHSTDESVRLADERQLSADAAAVRRLFAPGAIAVIGAGDGAAGDAVSDSLTRHGYAGELYLVGAPTEERPGGGGDEGGDEGPEVRSVAAVGDLPMGVDLAIISSPAEEVPPLVEACGERGVGSVAVLSDGFAERGFDGAALQWELVSAARRHGVRVLGPSSGGMLDTDPVGGLHALLGVAEMPPAGPIAVVAGAAPLGPVVLRALADAHLGVSAMVVPGVEADLGPAELLSYWAGDERCDLVIAHQRATALSPRLVRAARAASSAKPVAVIGEVLVAAGAGHAPFQHREVQRRVAAFTRQTGIISVGTLGELVDLARIVHDQPQPEGSRVAVLGNAEGPVALAVDGCRVAGLEVVSHHLVIGDRAAAADAYRLHIDGLSASVDAVLVAHSAGDREEVDVVAAALGAASDAAPALCVVATAMGVVAPGRLLSEATRAVPHLAFPEAAARAVGRLAEQRRWRRAVALAGDSEPEGCDDASAEALVERLLSIDGGDRGDDDGADRSDEIVWLDDEAQEQLLGCYGVEVAERRAVSDPSAAATVAEQLGWPVALKSAARDRGRRSAASGVVLDINHAEELAIAWDRMAEALGPRLHPVSVQRFIERGVDASVVLRRSVDGAATLEVGLGGPVSAFDDKELGVLPVTLADAQALVSASALGRALTDPLDRVALIGVVHRLATLFDRVEQLAVLEVDPIVASVAGAWVTDVRVGLRRSEAELDIRRLE